MNCLSPALKLKASSQSGLTHSFLTKKAVVLFVWWMGDHTSAMEKGKIYTIGSHKKILSLNNPNHFGMPIKNILGSGPSEGRARL